jgi:hypothetical protein
VLRDDARWFAVAALGAALATFGCGESERHAPDDASGGAGATDTGGAPGMAGGSGVSPAPRGRDGQLLLLDEFARPFVDVPVLVDGAVVYTGDDGFAVLPEVGVTYDVSFVDHQRAWVFQGLSSRAPVLALPSVGNSGAVFETAVEVQKPANLGDDTSIRFMAGIEELTGTTPFLTFSNSDGDVEFDVTWPDIEPATLSAAAFLVQSDPLTQQPLAFLGYATGEWPQVPAKVAWSPTFDSSLVGSSVHIDLTVPPGSSVADYQAIAADAAGRSGVVSSAPGNPAAESAGRASGDVLVPDLPGTTFSMTAETLASDGRFIASSPAGVHAGETVQLVAQAPPALVAPQDGDSVDADTEFSWLPGGGTLHYWSGATVDDGAEFQFTVVGTQPSVRLPDLTALGIPFPWGRSLDWLAGDVVGAESLDAYAAGAPDGGLGFSFTRQVFVAPAP